MFLLKHRFHLHIETYNYFYSAFFSAGLCQVILVASIPKMVVCERKSLILVSFKSLEMFRP